MKKILFFYPANPYPALSGTHHRCLEMLKLLKEDGYEVFLVSADFTSKDKPWTDKSIKWLKQNLVEDVFIYQISFWDRVFNFFVLFFYDNILKVEQPLNIITHTPPLMLRWFKRIFKEISPQVVFMNYIFWSRLMDVVEHGKVIKVIDTHDLISFNQQMTKILLKEITPEKIAENKVRKEIISLDFWSKLNLSVDPLEIKILQKFDFIITISNKEEAILKDEIKTKKILFIPAFTKVSPLNNTYSSYPLFTSGYNNIFNTHGFLFFQKKVLPKILSKDKNFKLMITGRLMNFNLSNNETAIRYLGLIPDLKEIYRQAAFFVSLPIIGTGQQIKIIEAMANGLPVVVMASGWRGEPIKHKINGFIAQNEQEMADYILELWHNRDKCRAMGQEARSAIEQENQKIKLLKLNF